jgi:GTP pyrophosphokinase
LILATYFLLIIFAPSPLPGVQFSYPVENSAVQSLIEKILTKCRENKYDLEMIQKGLNEAIELHKTHFRKSGEPYIIHPLSVALEIANLGLGVDSVVAAFLHDTIEDCDIDKEYISIRFNNTIANLVEGVTKLDELADNSLKRYTELLNVRKLLISASDDIRVLLIKLADRLHNMRTIDGLKPHRQIEYAEETLKVYVPLAEYIGIGKWKRELEDISFRKKEPETYLRIQNAIEEDKRVHDKILDKLLHKINDIVISNDDLDIQKVYGRVKSIFSIYNKIEKQFKEGKLASIEDLDISKIKDLVGISIILNSDEIACYKVLGLVHANFEHSSKDFDDYIARPKKNGYRSLQTTIYFENSTIEVQIKTSAMHDVNEFGPASHLAYKLSGKRNATADNKYSWIKNLNLWKTDENDETKYNLNAFSDKIFVITPRGRVMELPKGATVIDFAYHIHSEVGNNCLGAKINNHIGKVDTVLENGDVVEILTSKSPKKPSLEWINIAFTSSTKSKIRKALTEHEKEFVISKGKEIIREYTLKIIKLEWLTIDSGIIKYVISEFGCKDIDQFYGRIFNNNISKKDVVKVLIKKLNIQREDTSVFIETKVKPIKSDIIIEGEKDLEYKIAGCCKPLKGDEIIGIITLMDGLKIHRKQCPNLKYLDEKRRLEAVWVSKEKI